MTDDELVGRDGLVQRARKQLESHGSVLLYGPTGIGKSAVARALVAERMKAHWRVLSAAPSQSESGLPYVTLLDLFSNQLEFAWEVLPDHLRQPLEVALLKASAPDSVRDELAAGGYTHLTSLELEVEENYGQSATYREALVHD